MKKMLDVLRPLSVLFAAAGIVCFYLHLDTVVYIMALLLVLHSILNVRYGGQNNLATELLTVAIGAAVAWIFRVRFLPCLAVSLCFGELFFTLTGAVPMLFFLFSRKK